MLRKALLTIGIALLVVVAGGTVFVASRQNLRFDATPYPSVTASTDSAVVELGSALLVMSHRAQSDDWSHDRPAVRWDDRVHGIR